MQRRKIRALLVMFTGLGIPLVFAGLAGLMNGHYAVGAGLIVISLICWPIWLRLRREFR